MDFPIKTEHLLHRHGGWITAIHALKHQANKARDGRSLDGWWYVGDVQWFDGSKSTNHPIDPPMLCYQNDEGHKEVAQLSEAMMDYLRENGDWCDGKSNHEGWYAHRKKRSTA